MIHRLFIKPFTCLFICIIICCINTVQGQTLPPDELNSIIWIIRQYGSSLPQTQSFCNSVAIPSQKITCQTITGGEYHVTQIDFTVDSFNSVGTPDSTLTSFYLPNCTSIRIGTSTLTVADPNLNILSLMTNLPSLTTVEHFGDPSIKQIPTSLSQGGLPLLNSVYLRNLVNLGQIGSPFYEKTLLQYLQVDCSKTSIKIDSSWKQPHLRTLNLNNLNCSNQNTLAITSTSFPALVFLSPYLSFGSCTMNIELSSSTIDDFQTFVTPPTASFNIIFNTIPPLTIFTTTGGNTFNPDLSQFTKLKTLSIKNNTNLNSYPITKYPPNLTYLKFENVNIPTLPSNIPLPTTLNQLVLHNNQLTSLPWSLFTGYSISVSIVNNPSLTGSIPDTFCTNTLTLNSTGITSIPSCFWCYSNDPSIIQTTLTKPSGFTCDFAIDSNSIILINGNGIITGNNLGWGGNNLVGYSLIPLIPNKKIQIVYPTPFLGPPQTKSVQFNAFTPGLVSSFTMVEAGIITESASFFQLAAGLRMYLTFSLINDYFQHIVMIDSTIPCNITAQGANDLDCLSTGFSSGAHNITVINQHYSLSSIFQVDLEYPMVTSFHYDEMDTRNITLYGNFGWNGQTNPSVLLNSTVKCPITFISSEIINCQLSNVPPEGPASILVTVDTFPFNRMNAIYIKPTSGQSGNELKDQCNKQTFNCFNHGQCNEQGKCVCQLGYDPSENCRTKFANNVTIPTNPSSPIAAFDIDGIEFDFEIVAIQELDLNEQVIKELPTSGGWLSNVMSNTTSLTSIDYQFNTSNWIDVVVDANTSIMATISFSTELRNVTFGQQQLTINPNAIKLSVNISHWKFENNLSYLRVVFRTKVNTDQAYTYDCHEETIDPLSFDQYLSTVQYLRVVKDGYQFNGRFIDYSLADGRPTYSTTTLISLTPLESSSSGDDGSQVDESIALIGIVLSQCQECILDPDFTPLLIDPDDRGNQNCKDSKWRIIVGVVVGVVGACGVAFVLVVLIRKNKYYFMLKGRKTYEARLTSHSASKSSL